MDDMGGTRSDLKVPDDLKSVFPEDFDRDDIMVFIYHMDSHYHQAFLLIVARGYGNYQM